MEHFNSAVTLLAADNPGLKAAQATDKFIGDFAFLRKVDAGLEMRRAEKLGIRIVTISDDEYPELLKEIYDPPLALYIKGRLDFDAGIGVVGSRRASLYGLTCARNFGRELSLRGMAIISGFARGVDTSAHRGAIDAGGKTFAVLGSGLNRIYPAENENLIPKILEYKGGIISEYPLDTGPLPHNFPRRNRIISGLSSGVLVVEAAKNSGALITADCALEQGREVFALPGKVDSETSSGTNNLIRQGAKIVVSVDDILEEFTGIRRIAPAESDNISGHGAPAEALLGAEEKVLLSFLADEPKSIDELLDNSRFPAARLNSLLLNLELAKIIKRLPGQQFVKA